MAKNRKNQSGALRFGPALKAFALCLLIGGAAVGYVWQKNQIDQLGRQIKEREIKRAELSDQNKKLRDRLAELRSPARLEQKLIELNLGLMQPQPRDVWKVAEPVVRPVDEPSNTSPEPVRELAAW
jgi:septal ring factor EnvC (AmiA/AmiB activator)